MRPHPAPLAVALGDPAGIGPEIVAQAWLRRAEFDVPPFFAIGDLRAVRAVWNGPVEVLSAPGDAAMVFPR
ncbi:MAG: 4-hydroxythreonine-4-phosphate dehydrogenase PdxA, partial [Janthinobacterium lividum]